MPLLDISRVPQRWLVCALLTWAYAILGYRFLYFLRISAILESASGSQENTENITECPDPYPNASWEKEAPPFEVPVFYTTTFSYATAATAFQFGRYVMLIPAGVMSDLGFSKYVLSGGLLFLAVKSIFEMSESNELYILGQMLGGVSEAFFYPALMSLISRWAPPSNLYLFNAFVWYGYEIGLNIVGDSIFDFSFFWSKSWSEGNMMGGLLVLLWLPFGYIFIYHSPSESPFIHQQVPNTTNRGRRLFGTQLLQRLHKIPWCKIFLSSPFASFSLAYYVVNWAAFTNLFNSLIKFQKDVLHIPMESFENAFLVRGICSFFSYMIGGLITDWVVHRQILSRTAISKVLVFISVFIAVMLQVVLVLIKCPDPTMFWILYITSYFTINFSRPTVHTSPTVLNPWNAGVLMALTKAVYSFIKILNNTVLSKLLTKRFNSALYQLRFEVIFYSILAVALIVPYLVFGSEEVQNWTRQTGR